MSDTTQREDRLMRLYGTPEAHVVLNYLEDRIDQLAKKALSCDPNDIREIQGRAIELKRMVRRLNGELLDTANSEA